MRLCRSTTNRLFIIVIVIGQNFAINISPTADVVCHLTSSSVNLWCEHEAVCVGFLNFNSNLYRYEIIVICFEIGGHVTGPSTARGASLHNPIACSGS